MISLIRCMCPTHKRNCVKNLTQRMATGPTRKPCQFASVTHSSLVLEHPLHTLFTPTPNLQAFVYASARDIFSLKTRYVFPGSSSLKICKQCVRGVPPGNDVPSCNTISQELELYAHSIAHAYFCFPQRLHRVSPFRIFVTNNSKRIRMSGTRMDQT